MKRPSVLRWAAVAALLMASAAALFGVVSDARPLASHAEIPADELLAYDLAAPGSVIIGLAPKADELLITSWCVVGPALPEQRFVYGVVAEWLGPNAEQLGRSELAVESRVSGDVASSDTHRWSVRLAYSTEPVTDSRTLKLVIPELHGQRPSRVKLSASAGTLGRVLVRTTFPEARGALEREAIERSLTLRERTELALDRTSVPFDELPPVFRAEALSHWQRRLDASGSLGKDYRVARLLIGRGRAELVLPRRAPTLLQPGRALAFNVFGAVEVELAAPPGAALAYSTGIGQSEQRVHFDLTGRQRLMTGSSGVASTLVAKNLGSESIALTATLAETDAAAAIGGVDPAGDERPELRPLWLRSTYYRLDPEQPVLIAVAPGQDILGVVLRGTPDQPRGTLRATFGAIDSTASVELSPSEFEHWEDGSSATEPTELFLQLQMQTQTQTQTQPQQHVENSAEKSSEGVRWIALRGDATLSVAPFTHDPELVDDRLAGPFQRPLLEGTFFRYAAHDVQRRASLRGVEHEALVHAGRTRELWAQARVVARAVVPSQPEMALAPMGATVTRHVVEPVLRQAARPEPDSVWVSLDRPRRVVIATADADEARATLRYRIAPEHLGRPLALEADGAPALLETPITTSADVPVALAPGQHRIELRGLEPGDVALLKVSDAPGVPVLRQRIVYRLLPAQSFVFQLDKRADVARLILLAYAEGQPNAALSYSIEAALNRELVATPSQLRGRLEGPSLPASSWFWESRQSGPLSTFRDGIRLGEDLLPGRVRVTLRNEGRSPAWLAVVLVGQRKGVVERLDRFWALEEQ